MFSGDNLFAYFDFQALQASIPISKTNLKKTEGIQC